MSLVKYVIDETRYNELSPMKETVIFPIRRSRRPEALPQGVSSPDLPDGRKVIGLPSQADATEQEVEPAAAGDSCTA